MNIIRILKPALLVYEVLKIVVFAATLVIDAGNKSIFLMAFFTAQGVLFPIMALFLCLDSDRYKEYIPLYIAGKSIGIVILLGWSLFSRQVTMIGGLFSAMSLLSFELFAMSVIFIIKRDIIRSDIMRSIDAQDDLNRPEEN